MGSSPLTRGKHDVLHSTCLGERLIPAHAGKTPSGAVICAASWAHPRSRGENDGRGAHARRPGGSSPLTRGKQLRGPAQVIHIGLIPAHAGKTRPPNQPSYPTQAHPRSRGENVLGTPTKPSDRGSSPLTRGKLLKQVAYNLMQGLIPAHAGKTAGRRVRHGIQGAHPRSRGEN